MGGGYLSNLFSNKTKGFTLIELLAVIVLLAIIALIAVPIVLNIIEKARRGAAISSARSYIKATETYVLTTELNKKDTLKKNNKYNVTKETTIEEKTYSKINDLVEIKGTKPNGSEDYIVLGETYQVTEAKLTINDYEILIKNDEVISITHNGKTENIEDNKENESITINPTNGNIEISKTLQLTATVTGNSDKTVVWTSSDEEVAIVDSTGLVTGVKEGSVVITATTTNGKNAIASITVTAKTESLASKVQVGDYVAYNVSPNSVYCKNSTSLKGWRVLSISESTVTIVHAGQPECYTHDGNNSSASITALNNLAQKYINTTYAESAHAMNYNEVKAIIGSSYTTSNNLINIGSYYWLATINDTQTIKAVYSNGNIGHSGYVSNGYDNSCGFRPVVVLKSTIKTTGKTTDSVGQEAWNLVAP